MSQEHVAAARALAVPQPDDVSAQRRSNRHASLVCAGGPVHPCLDVRGPGEGQAQPSGPRVTVAPCTSRGRPTGAAFAATAWLLPQSEGPRVQALLGQKYGLRKRLYDKVNAIQGVVRRRRSVPVYLAIMPAEKGHHDAAAQPAPG